MAMLLWVESEVGIPDLETILDVRVLVVSTRDGGQGSGKDPTRLKRKFPCPSRRGVAGAMFLFFFPQEGNHLLECLLFYCIIIFKV
jgi:hypothetical protein